jgi:hypothetical protein
VRVLPYRRTCLLLEKSRSLSLPNLRVEHDVVKLNGDEPSIVEQAVTRLGKKHGFDVTPIKDGQVFDTKHFREQCAI